MKRTLPVCLILAFSLGSAVFCRAQNVEAVAVVAPAKQVVINGFVNQNIPIEIPAPDTVVIDRRDVVTYMEDPPEDELRPILTALKKGVARVTVTKGGEVTVFKLVIEDPEQADQAALIKEMVGDPGLKVRFAGESIVLEGEVADDLMARKAVNLANSFAPQVLNFMSIKEALQVRIKVHIVSVTRSKDSNIGVQYGPQNAAGTGLAVPFALNDRPGEVFFGITNIAGFPFDPANPNQAGFNVPQFPNVSLFGADLNATVNLAANEGKVKILQEPTLTVLNGQPAVFRVGGQFPVLTRTTNDTGVTVSVEYRPFGISLLTTPIVEEFTGLNETIYNDEMDTFSLRDAANLPVTTGPTIDANGTVRLFVRPVISDLDYSRVDADPVNEPFPVITERSVETRVALKHNESLVIGGLYDESSTKNLQRIPFISKIPILGELFKNRTNDEEKTELIFVLTPKVVGRKDLEEGDRPATRLSEMNEYLEENEIYPPGIKPTRISAGEVWVRPGEAPQELKPVEWSSMPAPPAETIAPRPDAGVPPDSAAPTP
jgi:pilus assembly protein CpaC